MSTWWLIAPVLCGFWLVLVAGIVWMSIALAKALRARRTEGAVDVRADESPLATLQRRLAVGEVDVETYERSVAALQRTTPAAATPVAAETTGEGR